MSGWELAMWRAIQHGHCARIRGCFQKDEDFVLVTDPG